MGALTNALGGAGVEGPGGAELSDAAVFASLGGIGFQHLMIGKGADARLAIDGLAAGLSLRPEVVALAVARLGARSTLQLRPDDDAAEALLAQDTPPHEGRLIWLDRASLPYDPLPRGYQRGICHLVGVVSVSADEVLLDDRSDRPLPLDPFRLRHTRSLCSIGGNPLLTVGPGVSRPVSVLAGDLLGAMASGVRAHLDAPIGNRGILGIRELAARIRDPGHASSWRRCFGRGAALFHAHAALYRFVQESAGPGLSRGIFAEAVADLGSALDQPLLAEHAKRWRTIEAAWTDLAESALPSDTPALGRARLILAERQARLHAEGLDSSDFLATSSEELVAIARGMESAFPIDARALAFRHAEIAAKLEALAAAEADAGGEFLSLAPAPAPNGERRVKPR